MRTIIDSQLMLDFLEQLEVPIKRHGKQPEDIAHPCQDCEVGSIPFLNLLIQSELVFFVVIIARAECKYISVYWPETPFKSSKLPCSMLGFVL